MAGYRISVDTGGTFTDDSYETLPSESGVWAYRRGAHTCVVNLTSKPAKHDGLALAPWQGSILG